MHPPTRSPLALAAVLGITVLTACGADTPGPTEAPSTSGTASASATDGSSADDSGPGHGHVEGASEASEPPLHLVAVDASGQVGLLDLLTEESRELGTIGTPTAIGSAPAPGSDFATGSAPAIGSAPVIDTDGRYAFVTTDAGVEIVDSGMWTWDHVDHFHYYRGTPALPGTVPGTGPVTVATTNLSTSGGTGLYFAGSGEPGADGAPTGEAVLLDTKDLSEGTLTELFRIPGSGPDGLVAPIGGGAVVTTPGQELQYVDTSGTAVDGATAACTEPAGTRTTRVGLVIGCSEGAVLVTVDVNSADDAAPTFTTVPYPDTAEAPRTFSFDNREGRPALAGLAAAPGEPTRDVWVLDTRAESWQHLHAPADLLAVSAVDDADGHLVGIGNDGALHVFTADGSEVGATEPGTLAESDLDSVRTGAVSLQVDQSRVYLPVPSAGTVLEIDYADGARISRELTLPVNPDFTVEAGL